MYRVINDIRVNYKYFYMKQRKLLHEIYVACLTHNALRFSELQSEEFKKIFKRKEKGKSVSKPKYTLVR
jgi:hypothetical protein